MQGCEGPTKVDPLNQALGEYLRIPGMKAAILFSDQGLMISGIAQDRVDTASIAALVTDAVTAAQRFGLQLEAGPLDTMRIEFEDLTVVVAPFAADVMLALVAAPGSLGALRGAPVRGRGQALPLAGETCSVRDQSEPEPLVPICSPDT
jgi:predicted regulator of Ras-like GTPase activity (Roadblock/LC7/MglB family)